MDQKDGALLSGKTGTGWKDGVINGIPVKRSFIGYVERTEMYIFCHEYLCRRSGEQQQGQAEYPSKFEG